MFKFFKISTLQQQQPQTNLKISGFWKTYHNTRAAGRHVRLFSLVCVESNNIFSPQKTDLRLSQY